MAPYGSIDRPGVSLPSGAGGPGPFGGQLLAPAAEVCACKRLPRSALGDGKRISQENWWKMMKIQALRDRNWWTLKSGTLYPSQFKLSKVISSGSPGVHSCNSLLCPCCHWGFARDAAESWLLAPQQDDSHTIRVYNLRAYEERLLLRPLMDCPPNKLLTTRLQ